jgi:hypothetical protein
MSQSEQPKKAGATFLWVLGAFAGFAVLFTLIVASADSKLGDDPRAPERLSNTAEIIKAQMRTLPSSASTTPRRRRLSLTPPWPNSAPKSLRSAPRSSPVLRRS